MSVLDDDEYISQLESKIDDCDGSAFIFWLPAIVRIKSWETVFLWFPVESPIMNGNDRILIATDLRLNTTTHISNSSGIFSQQIFEISASESDRNSCGWKLQIFFLRIEFLQFFLADNRCGHTINILCICYKSANIRSIFFFDEFALGCTQILLRVATIPVHIYGNFELKLIWMPAVSLASLTFMRPKQKHHILLSASCQTRHIFIHLSLIS